MAWRFPFFYGYVMLPVAMLVQICTSPGQTFAVSAFMPALRDDLGMSDSRLSLAYMLGTFFAAFPLSGVGPLADRFGLRGVTLLAVVALAGTCLAASTVSGFWGLLAVFLMLRFLGQGSLTLLGSNSIAMWFRSRLGRVSAVMSIGTALAFAWVPSWISQSIDAYGWRQTYIRMAALIAMVMVPVLLLVFVNRPEDIGQNVDGRIDRGPGTAGGPPGQGAADGHRKADVDANHGDAPEQSVVTTPEDAWTLAEASRTTAFPILAACNALWALVGTGVLFHLYTLCADRGMPDALPSDLFKALGLSMLAMQLVGGVLADFVPLHRLLGIGMVALNLSVGCLIGWNSVPGYYAFAVCFGGGQGLLIAVGVVVWVRYFGRLHLGKIRGTVWCLTVAGSGCGPFLMGISRDQTGSFQAAIWGFLALLSPLMVAAWFATRPRLISPAV
ncbi:MFS transporter [Crateriforma conspicua]|nr:MFS transporter [Crateriforma conspicua]